MEGGAFIPIVVSSGLAAAIIGKIKGSSFFLWFLVGLVLPFLGILAALLWRWDRYEPKRRCEECGNVVALHDQVCMRCGRDLEWPDETLIPRRAG
jgi:hypothetical protein